MVQTQPRRTIEPRYSGDDLCTSCALHLGDGWVLVRIGPPPFIFHIFGVADAGDRAHLVLSLFFDRWRIRLAGLYRQRFTLRCTHHLHHAATLIIFFALPRSSSSLRCCAHLHCCTIALISSLHQSFVVRMSSVRVIFSVTHSATSSLHCTFLRTFAHQFALGNPFSHFWP